MRVYVSAVSGGEKPVHVSHVSCGLNAAAKTYEVFRRSLTAAWMHIAPGQLVRVSDYF